MMDGSPGGQLELFEVRRQAAPRQRISLGRSVVEVRHDQLLLLGIGCLLGLTTVFALGVERGRRLVRSERRLLEADAARPAPETKARAASGAAPRPAAVEPAAAPAAQQAVETPPAAPVKVAPSPAPKTPAGGRGRYAVQVVSYRQVRLAHAEMERLQTRGERAFLVSRGDYFVVYVGPFPSTDVAREKLAALKARYQDCFVKTL